MTGPVIDISGLSVIARGSSGDKPILSDISFSLAARQVLGLIGESGSGKTVLSRALVGALRAPLAATSGTVNYLGRDLLALPEVELDRLRGREIAYIGANPTSALDPTVPVGHQIMEKLLAVDPDMARQTARARVIETLDAVRIPSPARRFDEYPFQFSGGMMQRALIVDALVSRPKLLIADSITQPLDVTVAAQILRLLRELQQEFDTSILFITSSLGVVSQIADDVVVLEKGRIVEQQTPAKIVAAPHHAYTRELIEKSPKLWDGGDPPTEIAKTAPVMEVRDVTRTYLVRDRSALFARREVKAVRGVSFDVHRAENFGLIGESGCGKSTLSRLLSALEPPDTGTISVGGQNINSLDRAGMLQMRRKFQLLLQDPYNAIPGHCSIGRTIEEPLRIHRLASGAGLRERVRAVMAEVGLSSDLYDRLPVMLSAGQRQRVNIARALVLEPDFLILDETLSSLDHVEQAKLLDLFESLQARRGITYMFISHDLAMVRRVCTTIAVMYLGRIVEVGPNRQIFDSPNHPYTRALLSAVPTIEEKPFLSADYLLEGEPPDPIQVPRGCTFRTRCPFAFDPCATDEPQLGRRHNPAACHLDSTLLPQVDLASGAQLTTERSDARN